MKKLKPKNKKVLVGGVFDILHYGHIDFLKKAKGKGDYLIVALESDENTKRFKGANRPIHSQKQREEILKSLNFVDEVINLKGIMHDADYLELVKKVKPFVIAVTEGDPVLDKKKSHAKAVGANVIQIKKVHSLSTSQIAKLIGLE